MIEYIIISLLLVNLANVYYWFRKLNSNLSLLKVFKKKSD